MAWSVSSSFRDANHAPVIQLNNDVVIRAKPGDQLDLAATVNDPDGDLFEITWWQFRTFKTTTVSTITSPNKLATKLVVPQNAKPNQTFSIVVEVKDKGKINLTSYKTIKIVI